MCLMPTNHVISTDMMLLNDVKKHIFKPTDKDSYRHLLITQLSLPLSATVTNEATECLTCCRICRSLLNLHNTTIHGLNRRTRTTIEEHNSSECRMERPESLGDCVVNH